MNTQKTWFVTGASKGLGLVLVKRLLANGYNVAATSRSVESLKSTVGTDEKFLPLAMNLSNEADVAKAINQTINHFGKLDVP